MHSRLYHHIKNLLLPCFTFSVLTGFFSAILVTTFKLLAEWIIHLSNLLYGAVRANPAWLPLLIVAAAVIGHCASLLLTVSHSCRGGGIPTSVAAIRGIVSFRWIRGILLLPVSALLSFLAGLPLGTEGPCVQMGTAVGDGVTKCLGRDKHKGWRRYIMTGGASAGFSIATASPLSAIVFSMEELHKHFSPMLLSVASVSVAVAQITVRVLASVGIGSVSFFRVAQIEPLAPSLFFAPLLIGLICGGCAILYTRLYHLIDHLMHALLKKLSVKIVLPILFALTAVVGFFLADTLGTGHSLVQSLLTVQGAWYSLLLIFLLRTIGMMLSNTSGATGGVFLPTLAFGAIIGALSSKCMVALGWIGTEHYTLMIVLGICAFLGATSRIPLTASVFAVEALGGIHAALPALLAVTIALFTVEASGLEDFTDTVINAKMRKITKNKKPLSVEVPLTATRDCFAIGKELRDVLWPNSCVVVSFARANHAEGNVGIAEGDVITLRYVTYDPASTAEEIRALVGEQSEEILRLMIPPSDAA